MQLLQLSSILQTGGQFTAESHGQFSTESVVSFPWNGVVSISGISKQVREARIKVFNKFKVQDENYSPRDFFWMDGWGNL